MSSTKPRLTQRHRQTSRSLHQALIRYRRLNLRLELPTPVPARTGPAEPGGDMKAKTMFYSGLGWVTYRVGKVMAKRKVKEKLAGGQKEQA